MKKAAYFTAIMMAYSIVSVLLFNFIASLATDFLNDAIWIICGSFAAGFGIAIMEVLDD